MSKRKLDPSEISENKRQRGPKIVSKKIFHKSILDQIPPHLLNQPTTPTENSKKRKILSCKIVQNPLINELIQHQPPPTPQTDENEIEEKKITKKEKNSNEIIKIAPLSPPQPPKTATPPLTPLTPLQPTLTSPPKITSGTPPAPTTPPVVQLFTNKYSPKTLGDIKGNTNLVNTIRVWLKNFKEGKVDTTLLIHGPPGIGKTTVAHLVFEEYGYCVEEYNCSDDRNSSLVENIYHKSIMNHMGRAPAFVMDEVDGMENSAITALCKFIRRDFSFLKHPPSKQHPPKIRSPMICICNKVYSKKMYDLRKFCTEIKFQPPTHDEQNRFIKNILTEEGWGFDDDVVLQIQLLKISDFRQLLILMQQLFISLRNKNIKNFITHKDISSIYNNLSIKDTFIDNCFTIANQIFTSNSLGTQSLLRKDGHKRLIEHCNSFVGDDKLQFLLQENYPKMFGLPLMGRQIRGRQQDLRNLDQLEKMSKFADDYSFIEANICNEYYTGSEAGFLFVYSALCNGGNIRQPNLDIKLNYRCIQKRNYSKFIGCPKLTRSVPFDEIGLFGKLLSKGNKKRDSLIESYQLDKVAIESIQKHNSLKGDLRTRSKK